MERSSMVFLGPVSPCPVWFSLGRLNGFEFVRGKVSDRKTKSRSLGRSYRYDCTLKRGKMRRKVKERRRSESTVRSWTLRGRKFNSVEKIYTCKKDSSYDVVTRVFLTDLATSCNYVGSEDRANERACFKLIAYVSVSNCSGLSSQPCSRSFALLLDKLYSCMYRELFGIYIDNR